MEAVKSGCVDCVSVLLAAGAQVDAKDNGGKTALMEAASHVRVDCIRALLAAGAQVDAKDDGGWTAHSIAVGAGHAACARVLHDAALEGKDLHHSVDDAADTAAAASAGDSKRARKK